MTPDIEALAREAVRQEMSEPCSGKGQCERLCIEFCNREESLVAAVAAMVAHIKQQMVADQRTTQFCSEVERARAEEREHCALVCDGLAPSGHPSYAGKLIRARASGS